MFRVVTIVMFGLMLMAVVVQYNDPDGWLWMLIYGYAVAVTWMALRQKYTYLSVLGGVGYLGGFFYLMPESFDGWYTNEIAREALGLLITAIWMVVLSAKLYRNLPDDEAAETDSAEIS
jgi:Transmembrane family 220, helix